MVVAVPRRLGLRNVLHGEGLAAALGTAAQQIVAGDAVVIGHLHHKLQPALADALFIMGQKGLGDPQILGGLFLGDAPLLAKQSDDPIEFHNWRYS